MNHFRKKAAVEKYSALKLNGASEQEISDAISQDEKAYTPEEVTEILKAIAGENDEPHSRNLSSPSEETKVPGGNLYEEWSVEAKYKEVTDATGKRIGNKLTGFEKLKKIRETRISSERADLLNSQSENTNLRLYLKS